MSLERKLLDKYTSCHGKHEFCPLRDIIQYCGALQKDFLAQLYAVEQYREDLQKKGQDVDINQAYILWVDKGFASEWRIAYEKQKLEEQSGSRKRDYLEREDT